MTEAIIIICMISIITWLSLVYIWESYFWEQQSDEWKLMFYEQARDADTLREKMDNMMPDRDERGRFVARKS